MSVPSDLRIIPTMTFRPMSPSLARLIDNAYRDIENSALFYPVEEPAAVMAPDRSGAAVDRRA